MKEQILDQRDAVIRIYQEAKHLSRCSSPGGSSSSSSFVSCSSSPTAASNSATVLQSTPDHRSTQRVCMHQICMCIQYATVVHFYMCRDWLYLYFLISLIALLLHLPLSFSRPCHQKQQLSVTQALKRRG